MRCHCVAPENPHRVHSNISVHLPLARGRQDFSSFKDEEMEAQRGKLKLVHIYEAKKLLNSSSILGLLLQVAWGPVNKTMPVTHQGASQEEQNRYKKGWREFLKEVVCGGPCYPFLQPFFSLAQWLSIQQCLWRGLWAWRPRGRHRGPTSPVGRSNPDFSTSGESCAVPELGVSPTFPLPSSPASPSILPARPTSLRRLDTLTLSQ